VEPEPEVAAAAAAAAAAAVEVEAEGALEVAALGLTMLHRLQSIKTMRQHMDQTLKFFPSFFSFSMW
jgi:hypothetical protein